MEVQLSLISREPVTYTGSGVEKKVWSNRHDNVTGSKKM